MHNYILKFYNPSLELNARICRSYPSDQDATQAAITISNQLTAGTGYPVTFAVRKSRIQPVSSK